MSSTMSIFWNLMRAVAGPRCCRQPRLLRVFLNFLIKPESSWRSSTKWR